MTIGDRRSNEGLTPPYSHAPIDHFKNTSAHLRVLRQARLVDTRRDGTYVRREDPRIVKMMEGKAMPFDGKRMVYGGFNRERDWTVGSPGFRRFGRGPAP